VQTTTWRWVVVVMVAVMTVAVAAQRGGGGRGAERPLNRTSYESNDYGFKFPVPAELDLYTPDQPGTYRRIFGERRIIFLVSPMRPEESILIKYSDNATEADLKSYKTMLDTNPPQVKLPGFVKIGVADVAIGKDGSKTAVNFVYDTTTPKTDKAAAMDMTLRQVVFMHKGRGFTVTCQASQKRVEKANKETFDKFLSKIEFQ
jgi:hypothetical protein